MNPTFWTVISQYLRVHLALSVGRGSNTCSGHCILCMCTQQEREKQKTESIYCHLQREKHLRSDRRLSSSEMKDCHLLDALFKRCFNIYAALLPLSPMSYRSWQISLTRRAWSIRPAALKVLTNDRQTISIHQQYAWPGTRARTWYVV